MKKGNDMKKKETLALMSSLGIEYPAKISVKRAEQRISAFLEEEGLPDDVELSAKQVEFLEELGFDLSEEKSRTEAPPEPETEAPPEKAKRSKKKTVMIACMEKFLKKPRKRQAIVDNVLDKMPEANESTVRTYITDGKNPKYNPFPSLLIENDKKKLSLSA